MDKFVLKSSYSPMGDQPEAIDTLVRGIENGLDEQVLLGVTGSGKTFTMASVIERLSCARSFASFFPIMRSNTLFRTTTIISPKLIFRTPIHLLKRTAP